MVTVFSLQDEIYKDYKTFEKDDKLKHLSKINVFIGSNNSGKSRLLRNLFSNSGIQYKSDVIDFDNINSLFAECRTELTSLNNYGHSKEIRSILEKLQDLEFVNIAFNITDSIRRPFHDLINFNDISHFDTSEAGRRFREKINGIGKKYQERLDEILGTKSYNFKLKNRYLPTLRGLRPISGTNSDPYLDLTVKNYFSHQAIDGDVKQNIYTGLSLYNDLKKHLLGGKRERENVKAFERFLGITFFNDQEINLTPRTGQDVVYVGIGGDEEHPIHELGDGIQSIIILTYPLFFEQGTKLTFFIEEPEHYLHPGFQRLYIETLLKFPDYQYFITTHSNHFLDLTLEIDRISVYTLKKCAEEEGYFFFIENVENSDANILAEIGVRNSSVFLSNCTIWVEGITDRIYIRKYLDVWQRTENKRFIEDLHYSFVEYGGNNITHWSFLEDPDKQHPNIEVQRLCSKLFLITDSDGYGITEESTKAKKALRQVQLKENLGERYYCLGAREIENLVSTEVLCKTIDALDPSGTLDLKNLRRKSYENEKLGNFLDDNVIGRVRSYAGNSGAIKDKLSFAKEVVMHINTKDDLSEEASILTERLYKFIKSNNS